MNIISIENISKAFRKDGKLVNILSEISLEIRKGKSIGIRGDNGTGKTTLFNILSGVLLPDTGQIVNGTNSPRPKISVVFQNYNTTLLPWYNVFENISMPLTIAGLKKRESKEQVLRILDDLKFMDLPLKNFPNEISGGQKQKIAIARALVQYPDLLLLDEPFSNLDFKTTIDIQDAILRYKEANNLSICLVSHDLDHVLYMTDEIYILKGRPATFVKKYDISINYPRTRQVLVSDKFESLRNKILEFEYGNII